MRRLHVSNNVVYLPIFFARNYSDGYKNPISLQSILKRRQQEAFVGREGQLHSFRRNLALDLSDDRRIFIFNVFGQGGIGKTSLLRHFRQYAEEAQCTTTWCDENENDISMTMAHIAEQCEAHEQAFKPFNECYHTYRQRRHELELDPEAQEEGAYQHAFTTLLRHPKINISSTLKYSP
ncbi:hypothetical protein KDA_47230 [Dictyobacter alpinus]|uniref:Orc1-like AAA ATPase domain-containing protein n=1 Tax=Dictyobacter alpinus TaxID=2014873 RepID=A0A402BD07_9CHLR|nr:ATP-binding protein [Dictyobacter alpinus]GCE29239.1 hypothetical protein KDA_47230 [Dictyobacter alpinus]